MEMEEDSTAGGLGQVLSWGLEAPGQAAVPGPQVPAALSIPGTWRRPSHAQVPAAPRSTASRGEAPRPDPAPVILGLPAITNLSEQS